MIERREETSATPRVSLGLEPRVHLGDESECARLHDARGAKALALGVGVRDHVGERRVARRDLDAKGLARCIGVGDRDPERRLVRRDNDAKGLTRGAGVRSRVGERRVARRDVGLALVEARLERGELRLSLGSLVLSDTKRLARSAGVRARVGERRVSRRDLGLALVEVRLERGELRLEVDIREISARDLSVFLKQSVQKLSRRTNRRYLEYSRLSARGE